MRLHALVAEIETARRAVDGGATVLQLRLKDMPTEAVVTRGRHLAALCRDAGVLFVVNDDVEAALALAADGVHLGRDDPGAERAVAGGLLLGLSAATVDEARDAEARGAAYVGAGPVWETPTKPDADPAIGLRGLEEICRALTTPVVAIGGVDASNAGDCIRAGASGVAVVRAAERARDVLAAVDEALAAR